MPRKASKKIKRQSLISKTASYAVPRLAYQGAKYVGGRLASRYGSVGGIARMASDIATLQSMVNAEKKRIDITASAQAVGQVYGPASSGYYIADITPIPPSGSGASQRTGASIKQNSMHIQMQFVHQSATTQPIKYKIFFIKVKGAPQTVGNVVANMFLANTFIGVNTIYDYNSQLNPDTLGQYKILRVVKGTIPVDSYSGVLMIKTLSIGLKHKVQHHVRFSADSNTVVDGQILMLIMCDSGNYNSGSASTSTNIPTQAVSTGLSLNYDIKHYYYDN